MGVMGCFRKGCESTLCDRYNSNHGYICDSCFEELKSLDPISEQDISDFFASEKAQSHIGPLDDYFLMPEQLQEGE